VPLGTTRESRLQLGRVVCHRGQASEIFRKIELAVPEKNGVNGEVARPEE